MFTRLMISGSRAVEFVSKTSTTALTNLMLVHRDSVLPSLHSLVTLEDRVRLRCAPLPTSSFLFSRELIAEVSENMRSSAQDSLILDACVPKRIPKVSLGAQAGTSGTQKRPAGAGVSPLDNQPQKGAPAAGGGSGSGQKRPKQGSNPPSRGAPGQSGLARGHQGKWRGKGKK